MSDAVHRSLIGQTIADKYLLESVLGSGGMSTVYRAVERASPVGRAVAVKVMRPALASNPTAVERFLREVETTCLLQHPNTVRILDFGQTADRLIFMVMEQLTGCTLADLIAREAPLPAARTVHILTQVCDALAEAHDRNIVHRDVKPSNIFLVDQSSGRDVVKVLDFGIAKVPLADGAPALTQTGMLPGSPPYMCPEYIRGRPIDCRADIYSIGCICFEMLSGQRPFSGSKPIAVLAAHVERPVPLLVERVAGADLPPGVDALLARALAKEPEQRFGTVGELRQALLDLVAETTAKLPIGPPSAARGAAPEATTDTQEQLPPPVEEVVTQPTLHPDEKTSRLHSDEHTRREPVHGRWPLLIGALGALALALAVWLLLRPAPLVASDPVVDAATALRPPASDQLGILLRSAHQAIAAGELAAADSALTTAFALDPASEAAEILAEQLANERAAAAALAAAETVVAAGRLAAALPLLEAVPLRTLARERAVARASVVRTELAVAHEARARTALEAADYGAARREVELGLALALDNRSLVELQRQIDAAEKSDRGRIAGRTKKVRPEKKKSITTALETAPKLGPEEANRLYLAGNRDILQGRFEDAIVHFKQTLQADPDFSEAHRGLGIVYAKLSMNELSVLHYALYVELKPQAPDVDQVWRIIREYRKQRPE